MKIAVIGVYYASNLGDAVICDCVFYWLWQKFPKAQIHMIDIEGKTEFAIQQPVSMRILKRRKRNLDRDYWMTRHNIEDRVYKWNCLDISQRQDFYNDVAMQGYDFAVFAGGQLFMDWLSVDVCEFLKRFEQHQIPVYFNACGTGLSISEKIRQLLKKHLMNENVKFVSSRDNVTEIKEKYLAENKNVFQTYDAALWTKEVYGEEKGQSDCIGLGIMYCENESITKLSSFWIKLIRFLEQKKVRWKLFCNGSLDDYNFGCYVLKKLHLDTSVYLYDYAKTPQDLVHQIAGFSGIISFRLHSHIIAASLDIPAVAIIWDEKLKFFYRHLEHEERCKTIYDSPEQIYETFQNAVIQGYNRELIRYQKEFSKNLLIVNSVS